MAAFAQVLNHLGLLNAIQEHVRKRYVKSVEDDEKLQRSILGVDKKQLPHLLAVSQAVAYALDNLQQRGTMFIRPGDDVYEGMIIAENARGDDMVVNPCKEKKLTNVRASGSDKNILLKPPRELTLELALEYTEADELVEVSPSKIRLRKKVLTEESRKRAERGGGKKVSV